MQEFGVFVVKLYDFCLSIIVHMCHPYKKSLPTLWYHIYCTLLTGTYSYMLSMRWGQQLRGHPEREMRSLWKRPSVAAVS